MATKKISALTELTTPAGTEELIVNAGGTSKKIQIDNLPSSLDDNSVTLAKMASGTDGNLITYDASGDPAYVTTGTSGQILTSGGTGVAPTFQTAAGATGMDDVSGVARATSGLLFNSDTAAANVLDDYEEGTWTPGLTGGGVTAASATYTKVGNVVNLRMDISPSSVASGNITITGVPFTASGTAISAVGGDKFNWSTALIGLHGYLGGTQIFLFYFTSGNNGHRLTNSHISTATTIRCTFSYKT